MDTKKKKAKLIEELQKIFQSIEELKTTFPESGKKFTIDGRLLGDIGEIIASLDYDIDLCTGQHSDYDGTGKTADGRKVEVQIKVTFKNSLMFGKRPKSPEYPGYPGYYLGFQLDENLIKSSEGDLNEIYKVVYNGPSQDIFKNAADRKGIGDKALSLRVSKLEELSKSIPDSNRIRKR